MRIARARPFLGTIVEIAIDARSHARAERASAAAFEAIARIHAAMSAHDPASELAWLCENAHLRPARVSPALRHVLRVACKLHALSNGVFDVTVGADLRRCGFLPKNSRKPQGGRGGDIRFLADGRIRFARPLDIDLGGIAKGYAVDRAVAVLKRAGIRQGIVNAGGDLRMFGPRAEPVHVRDAEDPTTLHPAGALANGAIATTAGYYSRRGQRTPVFDPTTGKHASLRESVTVAAPTCMMADALTKIVALRGDAAAPLLRHLRARRIPT